MRNILKGILISLFMVVMRTLPAYAANNEITPTAIKLDIAIIMLIVFLGILTSLGKQLLQLAGSKVALYVELISALMVLTFVVASYLHYRKQARR